jgi:uncharacterized damage-inducible protein DinB
MTEVVPWANRQFTFDFPVSLYPNILARVRGTPPRLEDAVHGLSRAHLIVKHGGKWSIQENAGHLLDAEEIHWRRLQEYQAGAETLTPAPDQNIELKHNAQQIGTILSDFRAARERQVELLTSFRPDDFARTAWHARLKVHMRLAGYLLLIAEHDDHHLARIWELRRA